MNSTKRILVVQRERSGFHHQTAVWKKYVFHFIDFCLHYALKSNEKGDVKGVLNHEKVNDVVRTISTNTYDAVFCESVEAFLLQFIMLQRGVKLIPFIITDLNRLVRAQKLCNWIESMYGINPFRTIISSPYNFWFCYTYSEIFEHETIGINRTRLFYVPCSIYFQDEVFVQNKGIAKKFLLRKKKLSLQSVQNKVVACGNNHRDYETLIKSVKELPFEIHIFSSDLYAKMPLLIPKNVQVHDYVSLETLYEILSVAKFVIIPLQSTYFSPGTATAGLSIGFAKPVIASDFPCLYDYVINRENGILVKPGDAESLRKALLDLYGNKTKQQRMSRNAKNLSDKLDAIAEKNLEKMCNLAISRNSKNGQEKEDKLPLHKEKIL